jgi:hypothetical protein
MHPSLAFVRQLGYTLRNGKRINKDKDKDKDIDKDKDKDKDKGYKS